MTVFFEGDPHRYTPYIGPCGVQQETPYGVLLSTESAMHDLLEYAPDILRDLPGDSQEFDVSI